MKTEKISNSLFAHWKLEWDLDVTLANSIVKRRNEIRNGKIQYTVKSDSYHTDRRLDTTRRNSISINHRFQTTSKQAMRMLRSTVRFVVFTLERKLLN